MPLFRMLFLVNLALLGAVLQGCAQKNVPMDKPTCVNPEFDKTIAGMLNFSTPLIGVDALKKIQDEIIIFDARKREEFEVSHLKGARYIGYDDFDEVRIADVPKDAKIVVYCSIGYRSEKIGNKLQKLGYSEVYNLYGSLFEWVNRGFEVYDSGGKPVKKVHGYNEKWSKWVDNPAYEKVW